MALGALAVDPETDSTVMQCSTYHLSAFASREESTTPQWNIADLLTGFSILAKVGTGPTDWYLDVAPISSPSPTKDRFATE